MGGSLHRRLAISQGEFYEVPWAAGSPLLDVDVLPVQHDADSGWVRAVRGPWVYLNPGSTLPDRGWKVHVSALPSTARETAVICWDACRELGVPFKVLRSRGLVLAGQQKYADPVASGKVVTCYPLPEQLEPLCELLASQLRGRRPPASSASCASPTPRSTCGTAPSGPPGYPGRTVRRSRRSDHSRTCGARAPPLRPSPRT